MRHTVERGWRYSFSLFSLALWLTACVPVDNTPDAGAEVLIDYNDPSQRALYDAQDQLAVDSLTQKLSSDRPELRYLAARGLAAVKSDSAVDPLARLLLDPIDEIRAMAAYALGQQGAPRSQESLLLAFDARDTTGAYARSNAAILEAVGKLGDTTALRAMATITTYRPSDTLLVLGQSRSLYRFALRGMTLPEGTQVQVERATTATWPMPVRLIAAHYLQRSRIDLTGFGESLLSTYRSTDEAALRMPLARALGKAQEPGISEALVSALAQEPDGLVRVELLRALGQHPYELARPGLLAGLRDVNLMVQEVAAAQLGDHGNASDAGLYWRMAKDSLSGIASAALYGTTLKHMPLSLQDYRRYINAELRRKYAASTDVYERAALLNAMAEAPWNYRFLVAEALGEAPAVVQTAACEALDAIARRPGLPQYFGGSFATIKREYGDYLEAIFERGDPGQMAVAANTLGIRELNFQTEFETLDFLLVAKTKLKLPRETETAYAIEDALAVLNPRHQLSKPTPPFNHPITWDIYRSLQPDLVVEVQTERGIIVIDLLEDEAPGTVINFVQLVRNGFYNGKRFHRIVPAFVTQGGGPRGDGYGSLDYTIRSELPPLYYDAPGMVGMASAGLHTEGVQFFFTHQATPHLDGRYTIFGRVTAGMDVVTALRPGDEMRLKLR